MISSDQAWQMTQKANRNLWLRDVYKKLTTKIEAAAQFGKNDVVVPIKILVQGSSNLLESAEMILFVAAKLKEMGYSHKIEVNGDLTISW